MGKPAVAYDAVRNTTESRLLLRARRVLSELTLERQFFVATLPDQLKESGGSMQSLRQSRFYKQARVIYRGWRYRMKVERQEVLFLLNHLGPGQTGIDIGAHRAAFCYWMAKQIGPAGTILAFEPLPQLASYLREVKECLPMPQMRIIEAALSNEPGQATLNVPVSSYLGTTTLLPLDEHSEPITVETMRLDDYCTEHGVGAVDFIKCDVEGFELEVFQGAERTLREHHPVLLFECEDDRHDDGQHSRVFPFLESLGYEGFFFRDGKVLPLSEFKTEYHQRGDRGWSNNFGFVSADRRSAKVPHAA